MGFHAFQSPYDWGRLDDFRSKAEAADGGLVDLSVGSPVDSVPEPIQQALAKHADGPQAHGYPKAAGTVELRTAIADWLLRCRGVDVRAVNAHIVPTVGSKEAVSLMASLLHLGVGDVVVQPAISYPTYEIGTQLAGATVLKVEDVADVESWVHVDGVKAVWVNSPSNPTGRVLTLAQLTSIVAAARSIGATVLSDECYALFNWQHYDSMPAEQVRSGERAQVAVSSSSGAIGESLSTPSSHLSPQSVNENAVTDQIPAIPDKVPHDAPCVLKAAVCSGDAHGVLALYSLSKQSNMAGYRTAFIAGDADIIDEMTAYRRQIGQIIPGPIQSAMVAALRDTTSVCKQWCTYHKRLAALVTALRVYGYEAAMPQGGLYVWVAAKSGDCWQDLEALANLGIIAAPGEFYGDRAYLRFTATATDEAITEAATRLAAAAIPLSPAS